MDRIRIISLMIVLSVILPARADKLTLVAGGGDQSIPSSNAATVKLAMPFAIEFDAFNGMYIVEFEAPRILYVSPSGEISAFAGVSEKGDYGDGGLAIKARFNGPHNIAVSREGIIFVADTFNQRVRQIELSKNITTFAGNGKKGLSGDGGDAKRAEFAEPYCVFLDRPRNRLLIADLANRRVRSVDLKSNKITTIAGNGQKGVPKDGEKAIEQPLVDPRAIAVDDKGTVYILERAGHALRTLAPDGTIKTLINTSGRPGLVTIPVDAAKAQMNGPKHLCVDTTGDIFIADAENHVILKYRPKTGQVSRVVGTGKAGADGLNGPPDKAQLNRPHGVAIGRDGRLYIADSYNNRIVRIDP
jgi:NHL repeat